MWGLTYGWAALKGDSPGPVGCGDSRINEMSEMTGLPLRAGGLQRKREHSKKAWCASGGCAGNPAKQQNQTCNQYFLLYVPTPLGHPSCSLNPPTSGRECRLKAPSCWHNCPLVTLVLVMEFSAHVIGFAGPWARRATHM